MWCSPEAVWLGALGQAGLARVDREKVARGADTSEDPFRSPFIAKEPSQVKRTSSYKLRGEFRTVEESKECHCGHRKRVEEHPNSFGWVIAKISGGPVDSSEAPRPTQTGIQPTRKQAFKTSTGVIGSGSFHWIHPQFTA